MNVFDELRPAKERLAVSRAALMREMGVSSAMTSITTDKPDYQQAQGSHAIPSFHDQPLPWRADGK